MVGLLTRKLRVVKSSDGPRTARSSDSDLLLSAILFNFMLDITANEGKKTNKDFDMMYKS